ncbi:MAG: hypothetical protein FJ087_21715 [Deltaproteobacteria bacterium]|nr:hypothetical protein [Deltaproteobacteria bacterium]
MGAQPEGPLDDAKAQPDARTLHDTGDLNPAYGAVKGKPFVREEDDKGDIDMDDVSQGRLGDCYFVAALAAVAGRNPEAIRSMITDHGNGTYTVRFKEGGAVLVDNQLPLQGPDNPAYADLGDRDADGPELWVALVEKAWAKLKGGYEQIRGSKIRMSSTDAMEAVTGKRTTTYYTSSTPDDRLLKALDEACAKGMPATAGVHTKDRFDEATITTMKGKGVYCNHAYAVVSVDTGSKTIELYNPWGKETARPKLAIDEFRKFYSVVHVNAR